MATAKKGASAQKNRISKKSKAPKHKSVQDSADHLKPVDRVIEAEFLAGAMQEDQFPPPTTIEVAFAGRSNVGKSSLLNSLMQRKGLVRTSSTPGCTRQVSWFEAKAGDGANLNLVDLPGYGYAKRSKTERNHWANLIGDYLMGRATLRGVVVLIDIRRGPEAEEMDLLNMLKSEARVSRHGLEIVVVATKMDKLPRAAHKPALAELRAKLDMPVIGYSVPDHSGRVPLFRAVRRIAGVPGDTPVKVVTKVEDIQKESATSSSEPAAITNSSGD